MKVAGVDGCKDGWFAVTTDSGKFTGAHFFTSFSDFVDVFASAKIIGVAIPIGLVNDSYRQVDIEAEKFLGKRASSIFSTPPRRALGIKL